MGLGEDAWLDLRMGMMREVNLHPKRYQPLLTVYGRSNEPDRRLILFKAHFNWSDRNTDVPERCWLAFPEDGHVFATTYQCTLVFLDYNAPMTFLPLVRQAPAPGAPLSGAIIVICLIGWRAHFVAVSFSSIFYYNLI